MKALTLFLVLLLTGCMTAFKKVRVEDTSAWQGVSVTELETHPIFASMQLERRQLSEGGELYIYTNSRMVRSPTNCHQYGNHVSCSGGHTGMLSCSNQFFVKDKKVMSYNPVGKCYTDCSARPASKPCS
jgi:hypothetical protein